MSEQDSDAQPPAGQSPARQPVILLIPASLCLATAEVLDQVHAPAWLTYGFGAVSMALVASFFLLRRHGSAG